MKLRSAYQRDCLALVMTAVILISSLMVPLSVLIQSAQSESWIAGWQYRKEIRIDHTLVGAQSGNFPVLIDIADSGLQSDAQPDGDDIMFSDNDGLQLSHEIELYSAGHLVAWVKVPNLSSSEDTVLYMYYGNVAAENQEDPAGVWDSNFMMVQHLSETSGIHFDSTVNGNDGSPVNGVVQGAEGKVDGADDFDGTNDFVSVSHSSTITGFTQAFTASFWVRMDSVTGRRTLLNKWNTNSQRAWMIDYDSSRGANALGLFVSADGVNYSFWYASFSPVAGNWYHIAVVWQSGQQPIFYINGAAVTATTSTVRASIYNNALEPLYIGRSYTTGRYFAGVIDEVRISNSARSAQWINTSYSNQLNPSSFYTVGPEESSGAPIVSDPYPLDGTVNVPRLLSFLLFDISDPDGDPMDYYVSTDPYIGGDIGMDQGNGTYYVSVSGLSYETTYTWHVNVTDGVSWTNATYAFTTELEPLPPIVSDPYPIDGATDVPVYLDELSVMVSDPNGDVMNITGTTDPDIGFSEGFNIPDTPFTIPVSGLSPDTIYTWHVNVTDGTFWINMTYQFTTGSEPQIRFKALTINHSLVADNLVNFPVLIDITDSDLMSYAQPDGSDIYFTDIIPTDVDHVQLSHEIEFYSAGHLIAWVMVPSLSSSGDTTIYMSYGDPGAEGPENPADVWDSNFMMVQHLSETSGIHYDSTVNGNNGSPVNGVVQGTAGKVDGADDFDGANDYVSVPHSSSITGFSQAFTASFWVKMDSITGRRTFLNKWNTGGSQRAWYIDYDSSRGANALGLFVSADGSAYSYWYASFSPVAGNWYHIAVVWRSGLQPLFYVNGAAVTATTSTVRASIYSNSLEPLYIGRSYADSRYLDGVIDEVRISNVARSAQWIQTCFNNQMNPFAFVTVSTPPTVVGHVPASGATDVPVTATVLVTFSEAMNHAATESAFSINPLVSGSFGWSAGDTVMTFTPDFALAYETEYTVIITTAAEDVQGEFMSALYSWSFTTVAHTWPYVVSHVPIVDETDVSPTTTIDVTFSEPMDRVSTENAFSINPSVSGSFSWNSANTTMAFDPASGLAYGTVYTVAISTAAIDMQGENLESLYSWSFTTIPASPPFVVSNVPVADAIGVSVAATILVTFSEAMNRVQTESAFLISPSVSGSFTWSLDNATVTLTPSSSLAYDTVYTVTITIAAMDLQGENMLAPHAWSFTTELPPPPHPTVVNHIPGVDATGVPVTATVEAIFSEAMDRFSTEGAFSLGSVSGAFVWSLDNTTMTFTPTSALAYNTLYTAALTTGAMSQAGQYLELPYSWSFTTKQRPYVVSHIPEADATDVPVATTVQVTFSEPMDRVSTESAFSLDSILGGFSWSLDNTTMTFTPASALVYDTVYTAAITDAATSIQGDTLVPYSWSFTTELPPPPNPIVENHVPVDGATDVPVATTIEVTFSEPMDRFSTESAFSLDSVSGIFTWSLDNTTMTFTPNSALAYETLYTATITTGAMSQAGQYFESAYSWSFTTVAHTWPYVVSHVPSVDATDVFITTTIQVTFSEPMDHASTQVAFSMSPSALGSFTWSLDSITMTFTPSSSLAYGTVYAVTITIAAMDLQGENLESLYSWSFTTELPPPYIVSHVPGADQTGVSVTTVIQVTFTEPMDRVSTESAFSINPSVSGSFSWSLDNTTMTFIPSSNLAYDTVHTVTVTTAAVSQAGKYLESSYSWSFTTKQRPTVITHVPGVDATDILVATSVQVTFSEPMDRASTESAFSLDSILGTFAWSLDNITLTFTPSSNLAYGTIYTVTIMGAAESMQGDSLVSYSWSYTTELPPPLHPTVVSHVPDADAVDVLATTSVQVTFSEAMDRSSTEGAFSLDSVLGSFSWSMDNTTMTFTPVSALAYDTVYTATITTAAMSQAGQNLELLYSWSFTTEASGTAPYVEAVTPAPSEPNVSQYVNIIVVFSEPMDQALTQGAFSISPSISDARVNSFSWLNASALVFNPFLPLKPQPQSYTVTISTAARDLEGENMLDPYIWSFTTEASTAPYVTLVDRPTTFTDAAIGTTVRVTFSETMDQASVQNSFSISPWVNGTFSWNTASTRITFTPVSPLAYSTTYTVTISTGAMDLMDEHMAAPFSFSFTTALPSNPYVVSTAPTHGQTNITYTIWGVKFSEPMDDDLTEAAFSINVTGTNGVNYYFDFRWVNSSYVDFYLAPLSSLRGYNVTISTAARDAQGENMTAKYSWSFRTGNVGGNNVPPYNQLWMYNTGTNMGSGESSPLIANVVASSPGEEVIYVGGDSGGQTGAVRCLRGTTGQVIWSYTDTSIGWNVQPQMGDIDNDGQYEIIVPLYSPTGILVLNSDGTLYWKRTGIGGSSYTSKPLLVDPDGDGYWMIFAAPEDVRGYSNTSTYTGRIWAFNYNGQEINNGLWGSAGGTRTATNGPNASLANARYQWFAWRPCSGGFSMADTDNDGLFELYQNDRDMYYGDGGFGKGTIGWEWSDTARRLALKWYQPDMLVSSHAPILVDINHDGVLDVVAAYMRGGMAVFDSRTGAEIKKDYSLGLPSHYQPVVYDIDRDGNPEILLADGDHPGSSPPDIVIFDLTLWKIDARMYVGPMKFPPTVGEVTGDGIMDIIAVSDKGIFVFDGAHNASVDGTYPVTVVATGLPYQLMYAVVQDIDNDGYNEIVTQSSGYRVYAYNTPAPRTTPRPRSEVQYYNERRTGVAEYVPPVFYDRTAPILSDPNPSKEATNVAISLSQLRFTITDLQSDLMNYAVTANFPVDPADLVGNNKGNGMYTVDVTGPLEYHRKYSWSVSVTDGLHWNNKTYTFITADGAPPGSPPTHNAPVLVSNGTGAYENATSVDLTASNQTTADLDGDRVTNIYRWLRNSQPITNLLMPFDTDSLAAAKDYSGYNNNAQIHGATWTNGGKVGGAYAFDGVDDYMVIPDGGAGYYNGRIYPSNLGGQGNWYQMTVEMWVNLAAISTKESTRLLMKIPSYEIGLGAIGRQSGASNRVSAAVWLDNPASGDNAGPPNSAPKATEYMRVTAPTSQPMSINTWYHVAFTYKDGGGTSDSILTLYINGVGVTTSTSRTTRGPIKASSGEPLYIGWYDYFKGIIDEVKIYSRSLSAEQIYQNYIRSKDGQTNSSTLSNRETRTGETWTCQVIPNDSHQDGTARTSNSLLILPGPQVPPVVSNVQVWGQWTLSNSRVWSNETIVTVYNYFDENDDPEAFGGSFGTQIRWYRNGTHVPARDNLLSLPTSVTAAHEDWTFEIKPGDGYAVASEWTSAANKVIVNSPPEVTSYSPHYGYSLSSITLNIGDSQTFSFTYTEMDGDPVTIQWQVDGVTVVENVLSYTWTATAIGSFTVRARITDTGYGFTTTTQSWNIVVR